MKEFSITRETNPYKDKEERAVKLYKEGLTLREIGKVVNRSHEWVRQIVGKEVLTKYDERLYRKLKITAKKRGVSMAEMAKVIEELFKGQ